MESGDGSDEVIEIVLHRKQEGLGFNIRGGIDMPHIEEDDGIFVTKIREIGAAALDGQLSVGDKILKLNDRLLMQVTHQTAVSLFKTSGNVVKLTVLKNAEDKAVAAALKLKQDAAIRKQQYQESMSTMLLGVGAVGAAVGLLCLVVYRNKDRFSDLTSKLFRHSSKYNALTSRPYRH